MATRWRDAIPSQDQDIEDQNTDAGKPQPYPIDPRGSYPEDVNVDNPVGYVELGNADSQHREVIALLTKLGEGYDQIIRALLQTGFEIIRVDAAATLALAQATPQSQHLKLRIQSIIISRATAGDMTLVIGEAQYPFTVFAAPFVVPFPIVIERGVNIAAIGDGRLYLVGQPE